MNAAENLPFCRKDSLICSQVSEVSENDPLKFCKLMGFKVEPYKCYDGTSASLRSGPLKRSKAQEEAREKPSESDFSKLLKVLRLVLNRALDYVSRSQYLMRFLEFTIAISLLGLIYYVFEYFRQRKRTHHKGRISNNRAFLEEIQQKR